MANDEHLDGEQHPQLPGSAFPSKPKQDAIGLRLQAERLLAEMFGIVASTHFGRYEILGELGSGGMGVVYVAHDHELDRKVAIKTLRSPDDQDLRQRLVEEARAMARVSHPNVITVFDTDSAEGLIFIVMEYVEGLSLRAWLDTRRRSRAEILAVFTAAGEGLAAAHDKDVIHRDFKPANVMVGDDGLVRVLDFGLARADPGVEETIVYRAGDPIPEFMIAGTAAYMAPEQFRGRWVDARSDQFAFCVSLHEALYGEHPYGVTRAQMWAAAERGDLRSPPVGAQVPEWLRVIVVRGLAPDPDQRFESMRKLLIQLVAGDRENAAELERRSLRITFSLDYDLDKIDEVERTRLQDLLRIVTGDRHLAIEDIARGSIVVTINVTAQGANRLRRLFEKRELSGRLGLPVLRVDFVPVVRRGVLREPGATEVEAPSVGATSAAPDSALLESWGAGDKRAAELLIRLHFDAVQRFFLSRVGADDAKDLTQETFVRLLSSMRRSLGTASIRTLWFSVARQVLAEHLRKRHRRKVEVEAEVEVDSLADHDELSPVQWVTELERLQALLECMQELSVEAKMLIELHYWQGLAMSELAEVFGIQPPALRSRMAEARRQLAEGVRKRLSEDVHQKLHDDAQEDLDEQLRKLREWFESWSTEE